MVDKLNDQKEWGVVIIRVPPELKGYEPSLTRFFDAMIYKLRRNAHKGKWEKMRMQEAMQALHGESVELQWALTNSSTMEILMEGADVANQALIVTEIALEVRNEQK